MTIERRWWWVCGAVLIPLAVVSSLVVPEAPVSEVLAALSTVYILTSFGWISWRPRLQGAGGAARPARRFRAALTSTLLEASAEHAAGTPTADGLAILIVDRL